MAKLSKWVENTLGKGEIARYEQFLLFPECFQKACFPGASKGVIVWEWVNCIQLFFQKTNSTLFQTKRVCRQQFDEKWQNAPQRGRKHCAKRRKCSL